MRKSLAPEFEVRIVHPAVQSLRIVLKLGNARTICSVALYVRSCARANQESLQLWSLLVTLFTTDYRCLHSMLIIWRAMVCSKSVLRQVVL